VCQAQQYLVKQVMCQVRGGQGVCIRLGRGGPVGPPRWGGPDPLGRSPEADTWVRPYSKIADFEIALCPAAGVLDSSKWNPYDQLTPWAVHGFCKGRWIGAATRTPLRRHSGLCTAILGGGLIFA
jgi:hypothetical protein